MKTLKTLTAGAAVLALVSGCVGSTGQQVGSTLGGSLGALGGGIGGAQIGSGSGRTVAATGGSILGGLLGASAGGAIGAQSDAARIAQPGQVPLANGQLAGQLPVGTAGQVPFGAAQAPFGAAQVPLGAVQAPAIGQAPLGTLQAPIAGQVPFGTGTVYSAQTIPAAATVSTFPQVQQPIGGTVFGNPGQFSTVTAASAIPQAASFPVFESAPLTHSAVTTPVTTFPSTNTVVLTDVPASLGTLNTIPTVHSAPLIGQTLPVVPVAPLGTTSLTTSAIGVATSAVQPSIGSLGGVAFPAQGAISAPSSAIGTAIGSVNGLSVPAISTGTIF